MRVRRDAVVVSIAVFAGLGLTACTSEPSLNEIAPRFEQDANEVFEELADDYSADPEAAEITNDGSENVPCDDGARREFVGTFPMIEGDPDNTLDGFTNNVITAISIDHDYEMVSEGGGNYTEDGLMSGTERTDYGTNEDETITFEVHAVAEPPRQVTFTGETACADT
ncbi:hypothetical protein CLV30_11352 [Haloactinopolyspora alba]|uniref:Uncharacterized protein n=1 Tax=Haloactinopolyspora alba TaxID=648780 RepID=A0A2P8DWI8_9ACTN|nr:hypothetical protein [Haloactinopolyspora alba]PSL01564.1 hypothetical protein CLV30_11352 [Haloactinopolyspora alba]